MYIDVVKLLGGLIILILGGDFLVRGASSMAIKIQISPLVVGLTVVAFGTSAPELLISLKSALSGSPDLAMGNVVGSNICNLALVLGVTAVINPIYINDNSIKFDWPMTMGCSILLYFLVREGFVNTHEGIIFVSILIMYIYFIIRKSRKDTRAIKMLEEEFNLDEANSRPWIMDLLFLTGGCAGLYYGAGWFVEGAQSMAVMLGVSERVVGLTVVALGTSLPELSTSIIASIKKETDIAVGNLLGSNIFNILSILGITSIVKEIKVSQEILNNDMWWMLGITLLIFPMMLYKRKIIRLEGGLLVFIYCFYVFLVIS
jgi:cation:H+ antiporter